FGFYGLRLHGHSSPTWSYLKTRQRRPQRLSAHDSTRSGGVSSAGGGALSAKGPPAVHPNILPGDEVGCRPEQIEERPEQVVGRFLAANAALRGEHLPHVRLAVIV